MHNQLDTDLRQRFAELIDDQLCEIVVLHLRKVERQAHQLAVHILAAHSVARFVKRLSVFVQRPAVFLQQRFRLAQIKRIGIQLVEVQRIPDFFFLRGNAFRADGAHRRQRHPLAKAVIAVDRHAVALERVAHKAVRVKAIVNRLPHRLELLRPLLAGKGAEAISQTRIVQQRIAFAEHRAHAVDHVAIDHFIQQVDFAAFQLLLHVLRQHRDERHRVNHGTHALIVADVKFVDREFHRAAFAVIADQLIRPTGQIRVGQIPVFRVQHRALQQLRRKDRLDCRFVDIGDIRALSVVAHLASGRNHADWIRIDGQIRQLVEIRFILRLDRHAERPLVDEPHAGKHVRLSRAKRLIAHNVRISARVCAEGRKLRRGQQQIGKHVILRRHRGDAVVVGQAVRNADGVGSARSRISGFQRIHDHRIGREFKLVHPYDGVVAVEHVAHVDVAGVVAKLRGEKASADLRRVADGQVRRLFALRTHRQRDFSDGRRGFGLHLFPCRTHGNHEQQAER